MNTPFHRLNNCLRRIAILCLSIGIVCLAVSESYAQDERRVLKANSTIVKIKDGNHSDRGDWILDPTLERDTYHAIRSGKNKTITFTTDIDSMAFEVEPNHEYDFVILLNGKDECKTRISTMVQGLQRADKASAVGPVTIPITIENGKLRLKGTVNGSKTLDLIFDTGAESCVIYPSAKSKGVELKFDGTVLNQGSGGMSTRQFSEKNRLEIADARWNHEPFIYVEKQAESADGIVGYTVFADRIVEIDYDRMLMVVHDSLPGHIEGYSKTEMPFTGSLPALEVVMSSGANSYRGPFIIDTAGNACMLVNQAFAERHDMHSTLQKVGTGVSRGVGSGSIYNNQLMMPTLSIAGHTLRNVPLHVELPSEWNQAPPGGVICMDILSRFNTILDFQTNQAYLKPNSRFNEPFKIRGTGPSPLTIASIAGILLLVSACVWYVVIKRTHSRPLN